MSHEPTVKVGHANVPQGGMQRNFTPSTNAPMFVPGQPMMYNNNGAQYPPAPVQTNAQVPSWMPQGYLNNLQYQQNEPQPKPERRRRQNNPYASCSDEDSAYNSPTSSTTSPLLHPQHANMIFSALEGMPTPNTSMASAGGTNSPPFMPSPTSSYPPLAFGGQPTHYPQQHQQGGGGGQHRDRNQGSGGGGGGGGGGGKHHPQYQQVSAAEVAEQRGKLVDMARSAGGSSFIQAALKETNPDVDRSYEMIKGEVLPAVGDLLLDAHGCYIVKTLMERMPPAELQALVNTIAEDESLVFSMCTHSLHTRRAVQYLLDTVDSTFISRLIVARIEEVSTTQQGCIVAQRAMDCAKEPYKTQLFDSVLDRFIEFATDPFANYVVQHMLEVGDSNRITDTIQPLIRGRIRELSCNKFASNVIEKCLFHLTPKAQHDILVEMYDVPEEVIHAMLQDSFGNYIIQSSIALASAKDLHFIDGRLRAALQTTPYGSKIEARLDRRLKGKQVPTRSAQIGASSKSTRSGPQPRSPPNGTVSPPNPRSPKSANNGAAPEGEEAW